MLLGALIRNLEDESRAAETLIGLGDLSLVARVRAAGEPYGEAPGVYVSGAVARFAGAADDEAWLGLMNKLERTDDPAGACLRTMVEWALKQETPAEPQACGCGGHH